MFLINLLMFCKLIKMFFLADFRTFLLQNRNFIFFMVSVKRDVIVLLLKVMTAILFMNY